MTWEAIIVAVSLVGMAAAWGVAYWCRRRLAEAHETYRDQLWDVEQHRDAARAQLDYAIARAEKAERQFALAEARDAELDRLAEERTAELLDDRARWQQSADALRRLVESQEQEQNKLTSERSAAEKERDAAIERAEQAEAKVVRLLKLGEDASIRETAAIKRADRAEEEIAEMVAQIETADKRVAAAIRRAEQAERAVGRLRALRTRIAEVLADHGHPGTVEVTVNTMCKGASDAS